MYSATHVEKLRRLLRRHGWMPAWCPLLECIPSNGDLPLNSGFSVINLESGSVHAGHPFAHLAPAVRLCLRLARTGEQVGIAGPFGCLSPPHRLVV